ncbi:MAG: FecR family protein [Mangrovibacterium sp.]
MNTNFRDNKHLCEGYLKGSLSKSEELKLVDWINSSQTNYLEFKKFITENQFSQSHSEETILAWQRLKAKISLYPSQRKKTITMIPRWLKIAAIVVISLSSGFLVNQIIQKNYYTTGVQNEIIVPNGEKTQLILSDGTKVYLNAGTHLKYPTVFSRKKREITLTGEAFFDVAKDKSNPFVIKTLRFDVKVTGTSFNLKTYQEDLENCLTLYSGEVIIADANGEYKIRPGEKYSFNTHTQEANITITGLQQSVLWRKGVIVIEDMNLDEIRKILEREFDVQIKIADEKFKKIRYTGQFKPHETLEEILAMIGETSPVKFKYEINQTKDMITIK